MDTNKKRRVGIVGKAIAAVGLALFVGLQVSPSPASAMNPAQPTLVGTVNTLYWDLDAFWKWALKNSNYRSPTVNYYNNGNYVAACRGNLYDYHVMAYCDGNQIWIAYNVNQSKVTRLGDYAAGFFLAHEWGHHIAKVLGYEGRFSTTKGRELYADCMAGVFTKYAYATSHRLDSYDYWEGVSSLWDTLPNEGSAGGYPLKVDRNNWYQWGFTSYNTGNCAQALTVV